MNQTCSNHEIIVVDDGSGDDTAEVLRSYGDAIISVYQKKAGVSAARNAGIRLAKGKWIAFLDSDDEWKPDYLKHQLQHIERYPTVIAHITNAVTIFVDGTVDRHFQPHLLRKFKNKNYLILERPLCTLVAHSHWYLQSTVVQRDALSAAGLLDTRLTIAEDLDLIARVSLKGPFGISRKILVETYRRPETIRNLGWQREHRWLTSREMFEMVYDSLRNSEGLKLTEKIALAKVKSLNRRAMGNLYLRENNRLEARRCYKKALIAYPCLRSLIKYLASFLPGPAAKAFVRK